MPSGYNPISSPVPTGWSSSFDKSKEFLQTSYAHIALKTGMTCAFHPLDLGKTLIQIGYEPIAPVHSRSIWGKPILSLPSVFVYLGHIRRRDGFLGLYRGLGPKLVSMGVSSLVSDQFAQHWPKAQFEDIEDEELNEEQKQQKAIDAVIKDIMERFAIIAVTQPLHVVTIRAMASFVGQEKDYDNIFSGLASIIRENGILGLWSGSVPRALGEAFLVATSAALAFYMNKYADKDIRPYTSHLASFVASSLFYPFTVVSHCSIVSRSGLVAGYPPLMPFYDNWVHTMRHLYRENLHKRGSSLLFRKYTGPQTVINNRVIAINPFMRPKKEL